MLGNPYHTPIKPGVWGWPQEALMAQRRNNGNRKFTIFAILLLPRIKTVADPFLNDADQMVWL